MTWGAIAGWSALVWFTIAGLFLLAFIVAEWRTMSHRSRRDRLSELVRMVPLVAAIVALAWPLVVVAFIVVIRREKWTAFLRRSDSFGGPLPAPTQREWQRGRNPARLLKGLDLQVSLRKHRLFALACCRRLQPFAEPRLHAALDVCARTIAGERTELETRRAQQEVWEVIDEAIRSNSFRDACRARACLEALQANGAEAALFALESRSSGRSRERVAQMVLLREIIGDPFAPLRPRDIPPEIIELARVCAAGDRELFGILADALDDLGEPTAAAHFRQADHPPGCHVLDWLLPPSPPCSSPDPQFDSFS